MTDKRVRRATVEATVSTRPSPLASRAVPIRRIGDGLIDAEDSVAVEEPLEICLAWPSGNNDSQCRLRNIAVTMRTPGNDAELAVGFLFTEGILETWSQVAEVIVDADSGNRVTVSLQSEPQLDDLQLARNFYMTSSCGVCGKASIEAIRTRSRYSSGNDAFSIRADRLLELPARLEAQQAVFRGTGSIHAAALFSPDALEPGVYEDVGRHNAVDKVIGAALMKNQLPLQNRGLLVSGRASFELVQKAHMAGCAMLAAVGAPSSLAIDLAWDADMTLIGFLRDGRFNIYAGPSRVSD